MIASVSLRKKIICGILLVLLAGVVVAGILLRDNIGAVLTGLRYSSEELEEQIEQNDQAIKDAADIVPDVVIRDLTEEDRQALKDGTITTEELIQSMIEPKPEPETEPKPEPSTAGTQTPKQEQPEDGKNEVQAPAVQVADYQKKLAAMIAEVYVLREEFLIKLDNLMAEAKAEYIALPKAERTGTKLTSLASKYYAKAHSLELECDARMKEIIGRMETLLKEHNGDLAIAQSVYDVYLNEKSLKKSWYLAELRKRGI